MYIENNGRTDIDPFHTLQLILLTSNNIKPNHAKDILYERYDLNHWVTLS